MFRNSKKHISYVLIVFLCFALVPTVKSEDPRLWSRASIYPYKIHELAYRQLPYTSSVVTISLPLPEATTDADGIPIWYRRDTDGVVRSYYHPVNIVFKTLQIIDGYVISGDEEYLKLTERIVEKMVSEAHTINGALFFPYKFNYNLYANPNMPLIAPWYSGMAQGMWLSVCARLYTITGKSRYLDIADSIFESLDRGRTDGIWVADIDEQGYYWIEEYPMHPFDHTLNGFMFAVMGLYDYYMVRKNQDSREVLQAAITTLRRYISQYRVENDISFYSLNPLNAKGFQYESYHVIHIELFLALYGITRDEYFRDMAITFYRDQIGRTSNKLNNFEGLPQTIPELKYGLQVLNFEKELFKYPTEGTLDYLVASMAFWFSPQWDSTQEGRYYIFDTRSTMNEFSLYLYYDYQTNTFHWPGGQSTPKFFKSGDWFHIVLAWSIHTSRMYIDGIEVGRGKPFSVGKVLSLGMDYRQLFGCNCKISHLFVLQTRFLSPDNIRLFYLLSQRELSKPTYGLIADVTKLVAGTYHTCAIIDNDVMCWGQNNTRQMGDNLTTHTSMPGPVFGLNNNAVALAAGEVHTCVLTRAGGVFCWGDNTFGQLGDNTKQQRLTPVEVRELPGNASIVVAGSNHTCAVVSGNVYCWGRNNNGQLGSGTLLDSSKPILVQGLTGVTALAAGENHTCAVTYTSVKCWVDNVSGQLGDNSTTTSLTPVTVSVLTGVTALVAGTNHTCAAINNIVWCWGDNRFGQLGNSTTNQQLSPVPVIELSANSLLTAGANHTCATSASNILCWGANVRGQLGDGSLINRTVPVMVQNVGRTITALAAGKEHTCAVVDNGIECWGANFYGQLGDTTNAQSLFPVAVVGTMTTLELTVTPQSLRGEQAFALNVVVRTKENSHDETPTGNVTFFHDTKELATVPLINGTASLMLTEGLLPGRYTFSARYAGDEQFMPSQAEQEGMVWSETEIMLDASPAAQIGQTVTFKATVTAVHADEKRVPGRVTFFHGTKELATVPLINGTALLSYDQFVPGRQMIRAEYIGHDSYLPSTALIEYEVQNTVSLATDTTLMVRPNPSRRGQSVTLTTTVRAHDGTDLPGGAVMFWVGDQFLGIAQLVDGEAQMIIPDLSVGTHHIRAEYQGYQGNPDYVPSAVLFTHVVQDRERIPTMITLSAMPNPAMVGQSVTFRIVVRGELNQDRPTGNVIVYHRGIRLGTVALSDGYAELITDVLESGRHTITAKYEGDDTFLGSTSVEVIQEVRIDRVRVYLPLIHR